jgi:hypothetical protein
MGKLDDAEFVLRCPDCNDEPGSFHSQNNRESNFNIDFKTFRLALKRFSTLMDDLFQSAIRQGLAPCGKCGRSLPRRHTIADYAPPSIRAKRGLHIYCYDCEAGSHVTLAGLPAIIVSFAGMVDNATYDVILKRDTYETLAIHSSDG